MVPDGWDEKPFGALVAETQLGTAERGQTDHRSIPLIKMGNLNWGGLALDDVEFVDENKVSSALLLKPYDLLFNTRNTPVLVGKTALWQGELPTATFDNNINRIRLRNSCDPRFVAAFMSHGIGKRRIRSIAAGSTSVAAIYWKDLSKIKLLVPPLPEQNKIADILTIWDKAIQTTEKLLANLELQKRALMEQLLTGKRRLAKFAAREWRSVAIGQIAREVSVRNRDAIAWPVISCSKTLGFVNSLDYFKKQVFSQDISGYKVIRRDQIGYPSNHIEEGSIGLQDLHDVAVVSPIYTVFETEPKMNPRFLYQVLKTDHFRQVFEAATNASVDRRGSLRWKAFSKIKVPLPSELEQEAINDVLAVATARIANAKKHLAMIRAQKDTLMRQLLTGTRRVTP